MTPAEVDAYYEREEIPVWREFRGGLWHSTPSHRFRRMLETGAINPIPGLPDDEHRWAACGATYSRLVGGVSLFDFRDANWKQILDRGNPDSWRGFLRAPGFSISADKWISTVWISVDRDRLPAFVSIAEISAHRCSGSRDVLRAMCMPHIEACHKGAISLDMCSRVVAVCAAEPAEFVTLPLRPIDNVVGALDEVETDWRRRYAEYYEHRALSQEEVMDQWFASVKRRAGLPPK